jgi:hypothetical protein
LHAVPQQPPGGLTDPQKPLDFNRKSGPKYFTYAQQGEKWYGFSSLWEVFCKSLILKNKKTTLWDTARGFSAGVIGFLKLSIRCSQSYPQTSG